MNLLYTNNNPCNVVLVYEHNNHKFRIQCNHTSDDWCCTLHVMTNDGCWKQIETNKSVNVKWKNHYYDDNNDVASCQLSNKPVIEAFKDYIESVY